MQLANLQLSNYSIYLLIILIIIIMIIFLGFFCISLNFEFCQRILYFKLFRFFYFVAMKIGKLGEFIRMFFRHF